MSMTPKVIIKSNILKLCEKLLKDVAEPPKMANLGSQCYVKALHLHKPGPHNQLSSESVMIQTIELHLQLKGNILRLYIVKVCTKSTSPLV